MKIIYGLLATLLAIETHQRSCPVDCCKAEPIAFRSKHSFNTVVFKGALLSSTLFIVCVKIKLHFYRNPFNTVDCEHTPKGETPYIKVRRERTSFLATSPAAGHRKRSLRLKAFLFRHKLNTGALALIRSGKKKSTISQTVLPGQADIVEQAAVVSGKQRELRYERIRPESVPVKM